MVIDTINNASLYAGLGAGIQQALEYLQKTDFVTMPPGRHDIEGERLYAIIQEYETRPAATALWEAHRRYIDVQYVAFGAEKVGYAFVGMLKVEQPYSEEKDCEMFSGNGDFFILRPGMFSVFFPKDAHMPGLAIDSPAKVKKIVIKVKRKGTNYGK